LASSGEAAFGFFLLLRGCAFSQLLIHNFRLYLIIGNEGQGVLPTQRRDVGNTF
jgi:hypothetical protein